MRATELRGAGLILIAGFAAHNSDHARRGFDAIADSVAWSGTLLLVMVAVVLTLVYTGHRRAPFAAAVIGPTVAIGVSAAHLVPDWGPLSDSLVDGDVDTWTWLAVLAEIAAGAWFGAVALRVLRNNRWALEVPEERWAGASQPATT